MTESTCGIATHLIHAFLAAGVAPFAAWLALWILRRKPQVGEHTPEHILAGFLEGFAVSLIGCLLPHSRHGAEMSLVLWASAPVSRSSAATSRCLVAALLGTVTGSSAQYLGLDPTSSVIVGAIATGVVSGMMAVGGDPNRPVLG